MIVLKKIISFILALTVALCISGCRNNRDKGETNEVKKANETLKIHCFAYDSLNPLDNDNETTMQMLRLVFESLIECDETQYPKMLLAEGYSVSPDGLLWNIKLKKGVKWHDDTDLTANDVLYTYNYVIENAENSAYKINVSNIESVSIVGDNEVSFKLAAPQSNFINLLEIPIVKAQNGAEFYPVGTGPYVYSETKNKIVHLKANDKWHKGKVSIKNIEAKILPDAETSIYAYVSKEIDVVTVNSGNGLGDYTSNSDNAIVDYPSNTFNFVGINTSTEPLSNRLFRKAIAHAIDKSSINSEVLLSHGAVADSCIHPKWWVYNSGVTKYPYSQDKALNVLNDVKKTMKISAISLMVNTENQNKVKVAEIIKKNLADCGISLYIEYVDWATFTERVATGNYQMYLGTVKYSAEINPQYVFSNPSVSMQKLFVELQQQTTEEGVKKKYYEIQEKAALELNIIPLYFDVNMVMYNNRIEGQVNPCRINVFNGIEGLKLSR